VGTCRRCNLAPRNARIAAVFDEDGLQPVRHLPDGSPDAEELSPMIISDLVALDQPLAWAEAVCGLTDPPY